MIDWPANYYMDLPAGSFGFGRLAIQLSGSFEFAAFTFDENGVVTLGADCTANITTSEASSKFSISDNGTYVRIVNRLGAAEVTGCIHYSGTTDPTILADGGVI